MQSFVNIIMTTAVAFMVPLAVTDIIKVAEPPLQTAATTTQPIPEPLEETKPLPPLTPVKKSTACNCYNILKENFREVPRMNDLLTSATDVTGNVAVFRYPATPEWPNGIPHVAKVNGVTPDGMIQIEEYNYHTCTHSTRAISANDKRLIGFTTLIPLSPSLSTDGPKK